MKLPVRLSPSSLQNGSIHCSSGALMSTFCNLLASVSNFVMKPSNPILLVLSLSPYLSPRTYFLDSRPLCELPGQRRMSKVFKDMGYSPGSTY